MTMAPTTTVRVSSSTRDAVVRLCKQHGLSSADLLAELVERREQDEILERMNASFARQRADVEAWSSEKAERESWEATLLDSLERL